jgi:hypothetical protein
MRVMHGDVKVVPNKYGASWLRRKSGGREGGRVLTFLFFIFIFRNKEKPCFFFHERVNVSDIDLRTFIIFIFIYLLFRRWT